MKKSGSALYLLGGVTAAGKTELGLRWAETEGFEILSCDSIAVFKQMDLGSAKPSLEDQSRVVHHGIDLVDVKDDFSVADYVNYASKVMDEIYQRNGNALVCGGSGFYMQSFLSNVVDGVIVPEEIRQEIKATYENHGLENLVKQLQSLNPAGVGNLDMCNPRRVIRGLERCIATGKSLIELKEEMEAFPDPYEHLDKWICWFDRENEDLEERIARRTIYMLENGLVYETEKLISLGLIENLSASNSVGYRECISFLKGEMDEAELAKAINHSTRRLVSKQRKWYRKHFGESSRIVLGGDSEKNNQIFWVKAGHA